MHQAEEIRIEAGTLTLAARTWGRPEDPPVMALHGWLDNAASFDALAPLLPGVHLVALDLPGHGGSDHRPPGTPYHLIDYVADVRAAADAFGWSRFTLLGHSLGGGIATLMAGALPERIDRLALIEALGPLTASASDAPEYLARALAQERPATAGAPRAHPDLERMVEARRSAGGMSAAAARRLVERGTRSTPEGFSWRSDPRLRDPSRQYLTESQVLAYLKAIRAPVSLVVAEEGLIPIDHPGFQRRREAVAELQVDRLPGHHHLHLDDPEPVAARLGDFLRGA